MLHQGAGRTIVQEAALYALNHVTTPYAEFAELAAMALAQGMEAVEIRNDLDGVPLADGTPARQLREEAAEAGVAILSINALQRFDLWNAAREAEAVALATYAQQAGSASLVLCPVNDHDDARSPSERARGLRHALTALSAILADHGITGLVEPLGFEGCALRLKQDALDAIDETRGNAAFALLHDSFHHALSGEQALFPARTGLVHISGVEEAGVPIAQLRDRHRLLVGPRDRLDTLGQIRALRRGGYAGPVSFEAFSASVHDDPDAAAALARSIAHIDTSP